MRQRCPLFRPFRAPQGADQPGSHRGQHGARRIVLQLEGENQVTVNMGVPQFEPGKIPFRAQKAEKPTCCGPRSIL